MSEPCSFFMRISIEKERYMDFMKAKPARSNVNDNWMQWWDSREMYGRLRLVDEISSWSHYTSNQEVINSWVSSESSMAFSSYDEKTEIWDFGIIMYSESYSEILPLLVFCESVFSYKKYSDQDFAIIYPYFWGDSSVMAYMTFERDGVLLSLAKSVSDVAKEHLAYAVARLDKAWEQLSDAYCPPC